MKKIANFWERMSAIMPILCVCEKPEQTSFPQKVFLQQHS